MRCAQCSSRNAAVTEGGLCRVTMMVAMVTTGRVILNAQGCVGSVNVVMLVPASTAWRLLDATYVVAAAAVAATWSNTKP
jgi:hypothetical protein